MHLNRDAKLMSGNFSRLRTSELRQLLNDDQKMSRIIRLSKKVCFLFDAAYCRLYLSIISPFVVSWLLLKLFVSFDGCAC